jgi:Eco57I restriction-modification methylase
MLHGLNGHLVSEFFLETALTAVTPDSLKAREESARRLVGRWRRSCELLGPASAVQTLLEAAAAPLMDALGFESPDALVLLDSILVSTVRAGSCPVVLIVSPWGARLDPLWRLAVTQALQRSAAWSLLFNGIQIRIVDASRLYARRFLEFDFDLALDDERTFAAFWSLAHASAFSAADGRQTRLRAIVDASQRHASGVSRSLRDGVLDASADLLRALLGVKRSRQVPPALGDLFEQALTIVYRILFLLFAEARGMVPLWNPIYRESYSLESLCSAAECATPQPGLWETFRAIARLAHAGCRAGDLRVTAFNGRLFAPARTPLAERGDLDDEATKRALLALTTRPSPDRAGRERIAYRDLGVEQLGSVYETILDYEPRLHSQPGLHRSGRPAAVTLERGSGVRKATGSFYTPQPIADYLVRRTLGPLVRHASPERILQLRVVDPAMGSGAFLVAACRYLADAYEAALIRTGGCHASDFGGRERAAARRTVAERCLYGVDVNPMAVQLARLSLWLTTLAGDRPLTFLDHHLQTGDSLLGAWLADLRRPPAVRRTQRADEGAALPFLENANVVDALRAALPIRFSLEAVPNDTLDQVRLKERALAGLTRRDTLLSRWKRVADLWCAPWFAGADHSIPATAFRSLADVVLGGAGALPPRVADRYLTTAAAIAASRRMFHWELEFPEVFFHASGERLSNGGFDAVLGNPPWDMIRADAGSADERTRSRQEVNRLLRFTRDAGVYTAQSSGHANRYQLFLERSMTLTRHGGRIGLVLPSGLATDHGSASLRKRLLAECDVDALVGFENHQAIFPIHRSVRFLLLTAARGSPTGSIACRFGERDPACLEHVGEEPAAQCGWFPVRLSPEVLRRLSGDNLAIPDIRSAVDLSLAERVAVLFAPLGRADGWHIRFGRELNATDDRRHLGRPGSGLPVVEGKQVEPFRADLQSARYSITTRAVRVLLDRSRFDRPRLAYRDVASATNRLTLIAAVLPAGCVSTHTLFCIKTPLPLRAHHFLCGLFNSLVVNYLVRLRVTTHVTTAVVENLPVPTERHAPGAFREIAVLARILARRSEPAAWVRLQALVAAVYQLTAAELEHVLATFPLIPAAERATVLRSFTGEDRAPRAIREFSC